MFDTKPGDAQRFVDRLIAEHNARRADLVVNLIEGALWCAVVFAMATYFI